MTCHFRRTWKLFAIPLTIFAILLLARPAHAEDVQPPLPESTPALTQEIVTTPIVDAQPQPVAGPTATDPAPVVEPMPTETVPTESAQGEETQENLATEEPPIPESATTDSVAQDAEINTDLVSSEPVVEISTNGDPYYTYAGITHYFLPVSGTCSVTPPNTCQVSSTPIMDAISDAISRVASGSVVIYVEGNATYIEDVTIASNKINSLTGKLIEGSFPTLQGNVNISNLTVPFSLTGFIVNGGVTFDNNTSTITLTDLDVENHSGSGISITNQKGAVVMNRVESSENQANGASIDTSAGTTSASVTITNSAFDDNNATDSATCSSFCGGLEVKTNNAAVTLNGVSASRNHGNGIDIYHPGNVTLKNSIVNDNEASTTNFDGILLEYASTGGGLTIENSLVNHNSGNGLMIEETTYIPGAVSLKSFEASNNLDGTGINFVNRGNITLENVTASGNSAFGAWMQNNEYVRTVSVKNGVFDNNVSGGLDITAKGNVTLTHVDANSNTNGNGVRISTLNGSGSVTLTALAGDVNEITHNNQFGVYVDATGSVTINLVHATDNGQYNTYINNNHINISNATVVAAISISTSDFSRSLASVGLYIHSNGSVTLKDISSSGNTATTVGDGIGVDIDTKGSVTITNFATDNNRSYGLNIDPVYSGTTGNVTINAAAGKRNSVSHNGGPGSGTNQWDGIYIKSIGTIVLGQTDVSYSGARGAYLMNVDATSAKPVTVTDCSFVMNEGEGLSINSKGAITLTTIISNENSRRNTLISSTSWTLNDRTVSDFLQDTWQFIGTTVDAATIELDSEEFDAYLYLKYWNGASWQTVASDNNSGGGTNARISLANLPYNGTYIIYVLSAVTGQYGHYQLSLNDDFHNNPVTTYEFDGIHIENGYITGSVAVKSVGTGKGAQTEQNSGDGLDIRTWGAVTLSNISANSNNRSGASIDACGEVGLNGKCQKISNVTLAGTGNSFDNNNQNGLDVKTAGVVSLTNISASENGYGDGTTVYDGIKIVNTLNGPTSSPLSSVILTANTAGYRNSIAGNFRDGVAITTWGSVTVGRVDATENHKFGMDIFSQPASSIKTVAISESNFNQNGTFIGDHGLNIIARGVVTLKGITANGNAGYGVYTDNTAIVADVLIQPTGTLNGLEAKDNDAGGLFVRTHGVVNISKIIANENGGIGAEIDNSEVPSKPVTITNGTFDENTSIGIQIRTKGTVIWNSGGASGNLSAVDYGAVIDTTGGSLVYPVTLSNLIFNNNHGGGLDLSVLGNVTLTNIKASDNEVGDGLKIDVSSGTGNVTITGLTAERNAGNGVNSLSTKAFSMSNTRLNFNHANGAQVTTDGNVTLNTVISWYNGISNGDGFKLILTNPHPVSILNSLFMANYDSGINITGMDNSIIKYVPVLTGTNYFGNFRHNGNPNLYVH